MVNITQTQMSMTMIVMMNMMMMTWWLENCLLGGASDHSGADSNDDQALAPGWMHADLDYQIVSVFQMVVSRIVIFLMTTRKQETKNLAGQNNISLPSCSRLKTKSAIKLICQKHSHQIFSATSIKSTTTPRDIKQYPKGYAPSYGGYCLELLR